MTYETLSNHPRKLIPSLLCRERCNDSSAATIQNSHLWAVVAIQDNGVLASESEHSRIEANRNLLLQRLGELGVIVMLWPSA